MVLILPFLLSVLQYGYSAGLTITGKSIVLYGEAVTLTCNGNTGVTWSGGISGDQNIADTVLTINTLKATTTFTCTKDSSSAEFEVIVASIAGISNSLCKENCEVSCTLVTTSTKKPTQIKWSSSTFSDLLDSKSNTATDGTVVTSRVEDFQYTSQVTYLSIKNLQSTGYYTCSFEFSDSTLSATVSALVRPTTECDLKTCTTQDKCQSSDVLSSDTCASECQKCYTYNYIEGDFIDNGQCKTDGTWCAAYLDDKKKCGTEDDSIVTYCTECGYCLDLEFSASKLWLPLVIFILLCLLTILMCYKSIEERMSILPKVHVTKSATDKIKHCGGSSKRGSGKQSIVRGGIADEDSPQYLTPASALNHTPPSNHVTVVVVDDTGNDTGGVSLDQFDDTPVTILQVNDPTIETVLRERDQLPSTASSSRTSSTGKVRSERVGEEERGEEERSENRVIESEGAGAEGATNGKEDDSLVEDTPDHGKDGEGGEEEVQGGEEERGEEEVPKGEEELEECNPDDAGVENDDPSNTYSHVDLSEGCEEGEDGDGFLVEEALLDGHLSGREDEAGGDCAVPTELPESGGEIDPLDDGHSIDQMDDGHSIDPLDDGHSIDQNIPDANADQSVLEAGPLSVP